MNYPEYVEVNGKKYKIDTDFRVAIECNKIATDTTIDDDERVFAILYKLYGKEGLKDLDNHYELLEYGKKYLACGKELDKQNTKPDMDYIEDYHYIWTSIYSDYNGLDIDKEKIHWWKFMDLLNGLSNSEMGNCCILNRVRNLRNYDVREIKDLKQREKIIKAKQLVALKKNIQPKKQPTQEQLENAKELLNAFGYGGE